MILSIITPVYNCEKFVEESLMSLCDQDFSFPTELILINDGSEDDTWSIVETKCIPALNRSKLSRVRVFNEDIRMFLPTRRNQALNVSKGKFIAIHDGDDMSLPGRFDMQIRFLMENKEIFCVGGHANKIDCNSDSTGEMCYPPELHNRIMLEFYAGKMNPIIDPTTMFRSSCVKSMGGYSLAPDKYTIPDFDLWLRSISLGYKFHNLQEFLVTYRTNPDGMTRKHNAVMVNQHKTSMKDFRKDKYKMNKNNWLDNTLELKYEAIKCMD
jgi:glycosyltransferase involved in cell wall biosynthesis